MSQRVAGVALAVATSLGCVTATPGISNEALRQEVLETERAFAKTMADRDHAAFASRRTGAARVRRRLSR